MATNKSRKMKQSHPKRSPEQDSSSTQVSARLPLDILYTIIEIGMDDKQPWNLEPYSNPDAVAFGIFDSMHVMRQIKQGIEPAWCWLKTWSQLNRKLRDFTLPLLFQRIVIKRGRLKAWDQLTRMKERNVSRYMQHMFISVEMMLSEDGKYHKSPTDIRNKTLFRPLRKFLKTCVKLNTFTIQCVDTGKNRETGNEFADCLSAAFPKGGSLSKVCFIYAEPSPEQFHRFKNIIGKTHKLEFFDCDILDMGWFGRVDSKWCPMITHLKLGFSELEFVIGDVVGFCFPCPKHPLVSLSLTNVCFQGEVDLTDILKACPNLRSLELLSVCLDIAQSWGEVFDFMLSMSSLQNITDLKLHHLAYIDDEDDLAFESDEETSNDDVDTDDMSDSDASNDSKDSKDSDDGENINSDQEEDGNDDEGDTDTDSDTSAGIEKDLDSPSDSISGILNKRGGSDDEEEREGFETAEISRIFNYSCQGFSPLFPLLSTRREDYDAFAALRDAIIQAIVDRKEEVPQYFTTDYMLPQNLKPFCKRKLK